MTDAQMMALIRQWASTSTREIIKFSFSAYAHGRILDILYVDTGGNYHSIGILPDGKLRTYE